MGKLLKALCWFLPVTSIPNIAEGFGSIALVQVLQSVTFQEDGQIVASISKAGVDLSKPVTPVWGNFGTQDMLPIM